MTAGSLRLVVTTTARPTAGQRERAGEVARRCDVPVVPRRSGLHGLLERAEAPLAYVVARDRERLDDGERRLSVERGLLHARLAAGTEHPLVRALGAVRRVVDGTLGLALDAMHVAAATDAEVVGIEASPALACLCEEGLSRLAGEGLHAARRVSVRQGLCQDLLPTLDEADAVLLAPMFDTPAEASPGWDLLRHVARGAPLDARWLGAALGAAPTVVIKARRGQPLPDFVADAGAQILRARAVDYWVLGDGPT